MFVCFIISIRGFAHALSGLRTQTEAKMNRLLPQGTVENNLGDC